MFGLHQFFRACHHRGTGRAEFDFIAFFFKTAEITVNSRLAKISVTFKAPARLSFYIRRPMMLFFQRKQTTLKRCIKIKVFSCFFLSLMNNLIRFFNSFNIRADTAQLFFQFFIAAVKVINTVDNRFAFGGKPG